MSKVNTRQVWILTMIAGILLPLTGVQAQQAQTKLGDIISEYGFDWLIGKWQATMNEGQKIVIQYQWALDKNLVTVNLQMGEYALQGMIFYKPLEEKMIQVGVDNRGGHSQGTWEVEGDKAVARYEFTGAGGDVRKMAIAHTKVDENTFKSEMFAIQDDNTLANTSWGALEYKRITTEDKAATALDAKTDLVGKWVGEYENEWGEKRSFATVVTKSEDKEYQIKLMESFDEWAETLVVLQAKQDESGVYVFEGDSDNWSGTGKGTVENGVFKGTFKGTDSGTFTMRRAPTS